MTTTPQSDHAYPLVFETIEANGIYKFPVIQALNFSSDSIKVFDTQKAPAPLFLEINLQAPCQMACQYCFTESATPLEKRKYKLREVDEHALRTGNTKPLTTSEISAAMQQFSELGGSVIFLCSEGEVILEKESCTQLIRTANELGLSTIVYTNMKAIDEEYAILLKNLRVNLSCKLESLNSKINSLIIPGKSVNHSYEYLSYRGVEIPRELYVLLNVYKNDLNMLGLSTTCTAQNLTELIDIRKFAYAHGMQHMIKGLHFDGFAENNAQSLRLNSEALHKVEDELANLNSLYGYSCPKQNYGKDNQHAYDIRTWLNIRTSRSSGMPAKVITNQAGAFTHWEGAFVSMRDEQGNVNLSSMFNEISKLTGER